ncbi:MAG: MarR family transcriptional regulator [Subtercola sp.]|nr:MarR family transcriptional regulator [Subtercola sp.]
MNETQVRTLQTQLNALHRRQRREWMPAADVSRSSLRVVGAVARLGDECQPALIAGELQMTSSNVAAALRELEAAGLIARSRDTIDSRRINISLTEAGAHLVADSRFERDRWLRTTIDRELTDDEQQLLLAAGDLIARLAAVGERPEAGERPEVGERAIRQVSQPAGDRAGR